MPEPRASMAAFAMKERLEAEALERHRMRSNAFYQQDTNRRNVTPPGNATFNNTSSNKDHPAFRQQPDVTLSASRSLPSTIDPRSSGVTTFSSFVNAGLEMMRMPSPQHHEPLQLVPEGQEYAVPTVRGIIEDRNEHATWTASGTKDDRTPVYIYSPRPADASLNTQGSNSSSASAHERPKSPKKKLLDRFNFSRTKSSTRDVTQPPTPTEEIAPKAAAVLGTSSGKKASSAISKKDLRHLADYDLPADPASLNNNRRGPMSYSTPQAIIKSFDPSEFAQSRRVVSAQESSPGRDPVEESAAASAALGRSKSLHYYDKGGVPPTPPTKDTPPELKMKRASAENNNVTVNNNITVADAANKKLHPRTSHHGRSRSAVTVETPSKPQPVIYNDGSRIGLKRGSGYVKKHIVTLHKSISVDSLRSVLVTEDGREITDRGEIQKAEQAAYTRMGMHEDGSLPTTTYRSSLPSWNARPVHSPSIYPEDDANADIGSDGAGDNDSQGGVRREKSVLQNHHHSSASPTRNRYSDKSVTFEPRHTSHHYEVGTIAPSARCSFSADDQTTALHATPNHKSGALNGSSVQATPITRSHNLQSDDSRDSIALSMTAFRQTDEKRVMKENMKLHRLNSLFKNAPDFTPDQKYLGLEPYSNSSAVPSPLHLKRAGNPFDDKDEEAETWDGIADRLKTQRLASVSTVGAGEGTCGSDSSLRQRFLEQSTDLDVSSTTEEKMDRLMSLFKIKAEMEMKREEEMDGFRQVLLHMAKKIDHIDQTSAALIDDVRFGNARVDRVQNMLEGLAATMGAVVEEVAFLDEKLGSMQGRDEARRQRMEASDEKMNAMSDNMMAVNGKIDAMNEMMDDFHRTLDTLDGKAEAVDGKLDALGFQVTALGEKMTGHSTELNTIALALNTKLSDLEKEMHARSSLHERMMAVEHKVRLSDRIVSLGNRFAALEQAVMGESAYSPGGSGGDSIPGTGLWKRRASNNHHGLAISTPPTSAGSSANSALSGSGHLWMGPSLKNPPRR